MKRELVFLVCVVLSSCASTGLTSGQHGSTKIIYTGWDNKDTMYISDHAKEIDSIGTFNGIGIDIAIDRQKWAAGSKSTDNKLGWNLLSKKSFHYSDFSLTVDDLKTARLVNLTENLFPVVLSSGFNAKLSWFDDQRWAVVFSNFDTLAKIMRDTGTKNVILDPEGYNDEALFDYETQNTRYANTFKKYYDRVRWTGQQVALMFRDNLEQFHVLALYGYTLSAINKKYDLLPAFYDGILDVLTKGSTFTDGYEQAYTFKKFDQFKTGAQKIRDAKSLSGNKEAYDKFVKVGFGLWPDYKGNMTYFSPSDWFKSLVYAKSIAGRFVWVYSEKMPMLKETKDNANHLEILRKIMSQSQRKESRHE